MPRRLLSAHHLGLFGLVTLGCESLLGIEPTNLTPHDSASSSASSGGEAGANATNAGQTEDGAGRTSAGVSNAPAGTGGASASGGTRSVSKGEGGRSGTGGASARFAGSSGTSGNSSGTSGNSSGIAREPAGASGAAGELGTGGASAGGDDALGEAGIAGLGQRAVGALVAGDDRCLAVAHALGTQVDEPVALVRCGDDPRQRWSRDAESHLIAADAMHALLTATVDTYAAVAAVIEPADPSQLWKFDDVQLVSDAMSGGGSNYCLDVPSGDFESGVLQLFACHDSAPQLWTVTADGQIRQDSYCIDLPSGFDGDDTVFGIRSCNDPVSQNQRFILSKGRLRPLGSLKCSTVAYEPDYNPSLEIAACDQSSARPPLQSFHIRGRIHNQGLCLTMSSDSDAVFLATCNGYAEQSWDFYF
jgi:hypothetical protein